MLCAVYHRFVSIAVVVLVALGVLASEARAQCPQPNGNDSSPDDVAINCLLAQGGTVSLNADVSQGYIISDSLQISVSGTVLQGVSAYGYRALLKADPALNVPILVVGSASNYTIRSIWLYGNKFSRNNENCTGDNSANARLYNSGFLVDNVESDAAPCNTSMTVQGSNFEIRNSWFANNGFPEPGPWADGLTVHKCENGYIHHNQFRDNTDVDLVVGGGAGCRVHYNNVNHSVSYGFAGIHIGWFPGTGADGNHSGSTYQGNTISSSVNKLAFGIVSGFHPWGWQQSGQVSNMGTALSNSSTGAVVNLAVDGVSSGSFTSNTSSGAQGSNAYGGCTKAANYTAADWGTATVQGGYVFRWYHDGACN